MLFEYARIKSNALTDGLIRYENGKVYNTSKANEKIKKPLDKVTSIWYNQDVNNKQVIYERIG